MEACFRALIRYKDMQRDLRKLALTAKHASHETGSIAASEDIESEEQS